MIGFAHRWLFLVYYKESTKDAPRCVCFEGGGVGERKYSPFFAHQVRLILQQPIQHLHHPHKLLVIALLGARQVLWMKLAEPRRLAKVRALPGHLEVQELLEVVLFRKAGDAELVILVVRVDEVLQDGARLPQGDARVGVFDGGCAAVGVDVGVGRLLDGVVGDVALGEGEKEKMILARGQTGRRRPVEE